MRLITVYSKHPADLVMNWFYLSFQFAMKEIGFTGNITMFFCLAELSTTQKMIC